jgi:hypothetical protein
MLTQSMAACGGVDEVTKEQDRIVLRFDDALRRKPGTGLRDYLRPGWASALSENKLYGQAFLFALGFGALVGTGRAG